MVLPCPFYYKHELLCHIGYDPCRLRQSCVVIVDCLRAPSTGRFQVNDLFLEATPWNPACNGGVAVFWCYLATTNHTLGELSELECVGLCEVNELRRRWYTTSRQKILWQMSEPQNQARFELYYNYSSAAKLRKLLPVACCWII